MNYHYKYYSCMKCNSKLLIPCQAFAFTLDIILILMVYGLLSMPVVTIVALVATTACHISSAKGI